MFAKARQSDMDLGEIGERLKARKEELADDGDGPSEAMAGQRQRALQQDRKTRIAAE
jgi:hypothetical protein